MSSKLKLIKKEVTVKSPGTVANMVCGFDIMGFALESPGDIITLRAVEGNSSITISNLDHFNLPIDPYSNVMGVSLAAFHKALDREYQFEIISEKTIKPGSGLGSSAASAAGIVVAANALFGNPFSKEELISFAMEGEFLASGSRHADNLAPCIYGGVVLVRSHSPLDIIPLQSPTLYTTILHPQIEVRTSDSRSILKKNVLLKDAITQWGNVAGLVAGLLMEDYELISRSLHDVLIEPSRSILIPLFHEVKHAALDAGALGGGISGSGPSIFMLSKSEQSAKQVEVAMINMYSGTDIPFNTYVSRINPTGVIVIG